MTEQEWLACDDPQRMLKVLEGREIASGADDTFTTSARKLRLFACACYRQVPHLLTDECSRRAVEVAERYADGEATEADLFDVRQTISRDTIAYHACLDRDLFSLDCSFIVHGDIPPAALVTLLREVVGNPFRPVQLGRWLTHDVSALVRAAYEERLPDGTLDPDCLAVLADALEEAGCAGEGLLRHLRGWMPCVVCGVNNGTLGQGIVPKNPRYGYSPGSRCACCAGPGWTPGWQPLGGSHVRGCHVVDLILGKGNV